MLPNLVIIGAMKSGTSSLHYYLGFHPDIHMSQKKELDFFVEELNWGKGVEWYESWFDSSARVRGEASPNYTTYPILQGIAERMHSLIPTAKLIYLLRDPMERMISHYIHAVYMKRESKSAEEALSDPDGVYLLRSRYYTQLEQYLPYYDRENILVLSSEELLARRLETLKTVFRFLGVAENFHSPAFDQVRHQSGRKTQVTRTGAILLAFSRPVRPLVGMFGGLRAALAARKKALAYRPIARPQLSEETRRVIASRLAGEVERLRAFTGRSFEEWSL